MKAILFLSVLALTAASAAPIAKITTLRGKTYRQCEIVKIHPDGVSFTHASGAAKILFSDLSKEWRSKLGYNPNKAAEYQKQLASKRQEIGSAKAKREQELNVAMAQAEQAARFRELGLAAQADAARRQQATNTSAQPIIPVLPSIGAIFDGRSIEQTYARPGFGTPWRGGIYGSYPAYPAFGFSFGGGYGNFSGVGFGVNYHPVAPYCPPPALIVTPRASHHTIITR
ncbi:MAG: hypothetical protein NTV80_17390 [Verrucomicrobia bacterium]|nr:hypothetical protein [Verrucomicrobiota bacterium]